MIHSISAFIAMMAVVSAVSRTSVMKPFTQGNAFKVIAGLNNFDANIVKNVVSAACAGGASHVDLACDASLVRLAKTISSEMPVCVSSIKPIDFVAAVEAGADMIEIGNFDAFYERGLKFSAEDVISMTIETRTLLPNIPLSVTVPHTLTLAEQVALAIRLEECGADIIQTEGKMSVSSSSMGVQEMIELAAPTLAAGNYSCCLFYSLWPPILSLQLWRRPCLSPSYTITFAYILPTGSYLLTLIVRSFTFTIDLKLSDSDNSYSHLTI